METGELSAWPGVCPALAVTVIKTCHPGCGAFPDEVDIDALGCDPGLDLPVHMPRRAITAI